MSSAAMPRDCSCAMSSSARCCVSTRAAMIVAIVVASDCDYRNLTTVSFAAKKTPRARGVLKKTRRLGEGEGRDAGQTTNCLGRIGWVKSEQQAQAPPAL